MKKVLSFVLVALLLCGNITPIFASEYDVYDSIRESVAYSLSLVEPNKHLVGLGEVDFTNLEIGREVKMYEYANNGFSELRSCYPIFHQNTLVAFAIEIGNDIYQISADISSEIASLNLNALAVVYDKTAVYAFDGNTFYLLHENDIEIAGRGTLPVADTSLDIGQLETASITPYMQLPYCQASYSNSNARAGEMASCNVPYISQLPYLNICWAAVAASIVNCLQSRDLTAVDVAQDYYGSDFNRGLPSSQMGDVLAMYGVTNYTYESYVPDALVIYNNLYRGYPIVAGLVSEYNGGHTATVFSISMFDGFIILMDPLASHYQYCYYSNGSFNYLNIFMGVNFTWTSAYCRYWS